MNIFMLSGSMGSIFGGGKPSPPAPDPALIRQRQELQRTAAAEAANKQRREAHERSARSRNFRGRRALISGKGERGFEIAPSGFLSSISDLGS